MSETDSRSSGDDLEVRTAELFARLPGDAKARDELVEIHRNLGGYLARRFAGRGEAADDLEQVAMIGLLKAVDGFDPTRGVQFATYATSMIVGELKRHFRDHGWAIRVPRKLQETSLQVNKLALELWQELGRGPTVTEIAERSGLSEDEVLEAMDAGRAYSTAPLDVPSEEGGLTPADTIGEDDEQLLQAEGWVSIAPALEELHPRERQILYLRFFRDLTQTEIAEELGISQMHVSRLLSQTMKRLRQTVARP
ncbi:MAG: SigB/SigF/SigG family RNA polymerase sigma factor [Actinomycetota bacterium]